MGRVNLTELCELDVSMFTKARAILILHGLGISERFDDRICVL